MLLTVFWLLSMTEKHSHTFYPGAWPAKTRPGTSASGGSKGHHRTQRWPIKCKWACPWKEAARAPFFLVSFSPLAGYERDSESEHSWTLRWKTDVEDGRTPRPTDPGSLMTCDMTGSSAIRQIPVDFFDRRENLIPTWLTYYYIESFVISNLANSWLVIAHL